MFELNTIKNIVTIAKAVLANNMLAYVKGIANNLYGTNNKDCGCGSICGMRSLYQFIVQAEWRQSEMYNRDDYQLLISKLFRCMSLQPEYYKYTGGTSVINATITPPAGSSGTPMLQESTMSIVPPAGSSFIPVNAEDLQKLIGMDLIGITREGVGMQNIDNTRFDYYNFDVSTGQVFIKSAANGHEIFTFHWQRLGQSSSDKPSDEKVITQTITANANYKYTIPAGYLLQEVIVTPTVNLSAFAIGNTDGGQDIMIAIPVNANDDELFSVKIYTDTDRDIWFNGITGSTTIRIYLRL